uniref:Transforming growth factor beta 1 induced transcript 1 n=1 Tax=Chelonoidis abingdonii TaxID=106734 RepID=A0A8C0G7G9_CHEAB
DLETTTSHISKRPVLLTDSGAAHAKELGQDGMPESRPPPPPYNPQQQVTLGGYCEEWGGGSGGGSFPSQSVVTALGNTWHPEHFVCTHCQKEMGGSNFFEKDGAPYCERDYFQLFSPRCGLCNEPILDVSWCGACTHPSCPSSQECYAPFLQGSFFEHGGRPFCETHYHKQRGSLCWGCEKPIAGRCITAMARKFHPEHFVCAFCLKQLNKGTFKEQNDKPYCHPCFLKLFG